MLRKVFSALKLLVVTLCSFLFFVVILLFLQSDWEDGRGPEILGWTSYTILSNSMEPTFHAGDIVVMRPKPTIEKQDIVTYMTPERRLFTHRIVDTYQEDDTTYYVTKGDNNSLEDREPIVAEQIVGTHSFTIPKIGYLGQYLRDSVGYELLILLPLLLFGVITVYEMMKKKQWRVQQNEDESS